jgi:hypothetical protein
VYDATRLTAAAQWLESSLPSTLAKIALFLLAAGAAGWAASGWAASAAQAALAGRVSAAATAGVYIFAGLPAAVALSYDLTAGRVDTHVLMNLAVLGTLATGHALEVSQVLHNNLLCSTGVGFSRPMQLHSNRRRRSLAPPPCHFGCCRERCCWCCSRHRTWWSTF